MKRNLALDLARILAIALVVMIHTTMVFTVFDRCTSSYIIGNIFDSVARAGVPLFLMVSGALMLDETKEVTTSSIKKKIVGIAVLFYIWSFLYAVLYLVKDVITNSGMHIGSYLKTFIFGDFHMWFLFVIAGLYAITPILRRITTKDNGKMCLYLIGLSLLFVFTEPLFLLFKDHSSIIALLYAYISYFKLSAVGAYAAYYITGWYIFNIGIKHKKCLYAISIISLAVTIILVQLTGNYSVVFSNEGLNIFLYSVGLFTLITDKFNRTHNSKLITSLSLLSFGVYMIHPVALLAFDFVIPLKSITVLYILIKFAVLLGASYLSALLLSKIPFFKRMIRF